MNEELIKMLDEIQKEPPTIPQNVNPPIGVGQVWFPHYSENLREELKETKLLQKCRPVYINAITGKTVTAFKLKTLHNPNERRAGQVLIMDPEEILRTVECLEITTFHADDFSTPDAQYLYTLSEDTQFVIMLTNAVLQGVPVSYTRGVHQRLQNYLDFIKGDDKSSDEPTTNVKINLSQTEKFNEKWNEEQPTTDSGRKDESKESPKAKSKAKPVKKKNTTGSRNFKPIQGADMIIPQIKDYIEKLPAILKLSASKAEFNEFSDGFLEDGKIAITAGIHKNVYEMMVADKIIDKTKVGYYSYRNMMLRRKLCEDKNVTIITATGSKKSITVTLFDIKAKDPVAAAG